MILGRVGIWGKKKRPGKARMRDGGRQIKSGKGDGSQTKARVGEKNEER